MLKLTFLFMSDATFVKEVPIFAWSDKITAIILNNLISIARHFHGTLFLSTVIRWWTMDDGHNIPKVVRWLILSQSMIMKRITRVN
jgi:hypothetical protein